MEKTSQEACPDMDHAWWTPEGLWKLPLKPNDASSSSPLGHFRGDTGWQGRARVEAEAWHGSDHLKQSEKQDQDKAALRASGHLKSPAVKPLRA